MQDYLINMVNALFKGWVITARRVKIKLKTKIFIKKDMKK